ncbi:serine/threonine-protein kinase pim-2 [Pimephales promelas]|nr:serine/threonine-protein kinase pim-2 [Pimephales promelas]
MTQARALLTRAAFGSACVHLSICVAMVRLTGRESGRETASRAQMMDVRPLLLSQDSRRAKAKTEEEEMPMRKRRRMESLVKPHSCDWSGIIPDRRTAAIPERRAEEDHGLQDAVSSGVEDQRVQTPPAPALLQECFKPVSEESASQERARKKSSVDPLSLHWSSGEHLSLHSSGSGQGSRVEDQTTATISERHAEEHPGLQRVQTPPAPVHHSPVRPAPAHSDRADATAEDGILRRYEMGRMLGEGSFGSVYEAKRLEDGLQVAVKIASKPKDTKYIHIPGHPAPVPLEVGLLTLANSGPKVSEIIELLDWQDQPDRYIMVLERPAPCTDLWEYWNDHEGILHEDTARVIMAQATVAAHVCCRRGVFHRDIKLENLLINTETLEVKLIDFGCGDLLRDSGYETFCGTRDYRPPEYLTEGKYHGKPATVWSLGVLLFLLVCGRLPEARDRRRIEEDVWSKPRLSNDPALDPEFQSSAALQIFLTFCTLTESSARLFAILLAAGCEFGCVVAV